MDRGLGQGASQKGSADPGWSQALEEALGNFKEDTSEDYNTCKIRSELVSPHLALTLRPRRELRTSRNCTSKGQGSQGGIAYKCEMCYFSVYANGFFHPNP